MKTVISIPDNIYNEAEITAKQLGLARSQLYVLVIKELIEHHNNDRITEKINSVFSNENNCDDIQEIGLESLRKATENDKWRNMVG